MRITSERDNRQGWSVSQSLRLLDALNGSVHSFSYKGEPQTENQPHHQSDEDIEKLLRADRQLGRFCRINHVDIRGAQTRRDRGILELLQQVVIKLLIGIRLPLQETVLDQKLVQRAHFDFFFGDSGLEEPLPSYGGPVVILNPLHGPFSLLLDQRLNFIHLTL